jgi:hypothetical protein
LIAPNIAANAPHAVSDWRVANWSAAVREALGRRALWNFRLAFAVVLAPSVLLAAYGVWSQRPTLLIWVLLALWGFGTASTGPTGIGMLASLLVAFSGSVIAVTQHDALFALAGLMPGVTWFASCAVLGVTASYLLEALRSSESTVRTLCDRGVLMPVAGATARSDRDRDEAQAPVPPH